MNSYLGQSVHFVLDRGFNIGQCRHAVIVGGTEIYPNLSVYPDGQGDGISKSEGALVYTRGVPFGHTSEARPGTCHWPTDPSACEKVAQEAKKK